MRQAALLGYTDTNPSSIPPAFLNECEDYVRRCLTFELAFDSSVKYEEPDFVYDFSESVSARMKLQYVMSALRAEFNLPPAANRTLALILGQPVPLKSSGYRVSYDAECLTLGTVTPADGQLGASFLAFEGGENTPQTPNGNLKVAAVGLSLSVVPNLSQHTYTQKSPTASGGCGSPQSDATIFASWGTALSPTFLGNYAEGDNGAYVTGWKMVGGDIIATKDITVTDGSPGNGYSATGPVQMVLFHKAE